MLKADCSGQPRRGSHYVNSFPSWRQSKSIVICYNHLNGKSDSGAGGEGATAREVLRHKSVEEVVMVDIDKVLVITGLMYCVLANMIGHHIQHSHSSNGAHDMTAAAATAAMSILQLWVAWLV